MLVYQRVGVPQSQWIVFPANSACRLMERTSAFKPSQSQSTAWTFISWEIKNWENRLHQYDIDGIIYWEYTLLGYTN